MKKMFYFVKITLVLLLIASLTAALLAFVNRMTVDVIDKNTEAERNEAIEEIFSEMSSTAPIDMTLPDAVNAAYSVLDANGEIIGYCVDANGYGYGSDAINILVGIGVDGKVVDTKVIAHSETPGLGSKATEPSFLAQFAARSGSLAVTKDGGDIDAVAGATVSSRAITAGVSAALSLGLGSEGGE